jgi:ribosomal protein S27AE
MIESRTETVRTWSCDRCGATESASWGSEDQSIQPLVPEGWRIIQLLNDHGHYCPECGESFEAWLRNEPTS